MRHAETHLKLHQLFNERQFDDMDAYVGEQYAYIDHARGITMHSLDEFKDWMREWTTAFSDAHVLGESFVEGENVSVAYFHGRGENDGPMGSLPATRRQMDIPFCETLRYDQQGRVIGGEVYYDQLGILTQLGHIESSKLTGTA
ncbi:ester cyclase [Actinopolyspora sp. H202]|uniref:ester cyclase n=1 Tax=Actinopolyspora sp. H202 TaxID=1500456 RepID=UPI003EE77317